MSAQRDEFLRGLWIARQTMQRAGIDLASIDLMSPMDGMRLMAMLDPHDLTGQVPWLRKDGTPGSQLEIEGILVRWPQQRFVLPGGGWRDGE